MVPKTFFVTLLWPHKIANYYSKELEKPVEEQYNEYTSPGLFWLIVAVLPFFVYLSRFPNSILVYGGETMQGKLVFMAFILLSPPVSFAWQYLSEKNQQITRKNFTSGISYQFYFFGVFTSVFPLIFFLGKLKVDPLYTGLLGIAVIGWLIYAEIRFALNSQSTIKVFRFLIFSVLKAAFCITVLVLIMNTWK
jgi:hypothetical protein